MAFCLMPDQINEFKKALKDKDINLADLLGMDSAKRTEMFSKYAGENAKDVNLLFEQKLVLKNKLQGIKNWASKVGEIGRYSPSKKAETAKMIEDYNSQKLERTFSPKEEEAFLNDLADSKIGTHITREEARQVYELTSKVEELKQGFNPETGWTSPEIGKEYGAAKVLMNKYTEGLKNENLTLAQLIQRRYGEAKTTWGENRAKAGTDLVKDTIKEIIDNSISFVASIDNSFMGRQGLSLLASWRFREWGNMAGKSFTDIYKVLAEKHGYEKVKDALMADAYSRENYINGNYDTAKLIPKTEEQFPTNLPGRLPVIGKLFKASEAAFVNSAIRARINTFDTIYDIAKKNGVDIYNKTEIQAIGKLINSVTARGDIGRLGEGGIVRVILWAPKMLKANWDVLTAHTGGAGLETSFARQQARHNLYKIVTSTASVAAIANALSPGSVETNPLSSDFMKIKVGNTRFDITGGKASLVTLLARAATFSTKSSVTGKTTSLNSGKYGAKDMFDVGVDFLVNKTTPPARAVVDIARGRNFKGDKPTIASVGFGLTTPISIQNFVNNYYGKDTDSSTAAVVGSFVDIFGINANTYSKRRKMY
jgi:hypothetical protein